MVNNIALLQNIEDITCKVNDDGFVILANNIAFGARNRCRLRINDELSCVGEISHSPPALLQNPDFDRNDQECYCERIWYKGNVYHSIAYRYKRNSNSYTITFFHENQKRYDTVLYFVKNGDRCTMVVKCLVETEQRLFDDMVGWLPDVDQFINNFQLGSGFRHVESNQ